MDVQTLRDELDRMVRLGHGRLPVRDEDENDVAEVFAPGDSDNGCVTLVCYIAHEYAGEDDSDEHDEHDERDDETTEDE